MKRENKMRRQEIQMKFVLSHSFTVVREPTIVNFSTLSYYQKTRSPKMVCVPPIISSDSTNLSSCPCLC